MDDTAAFKFDSLPGVTFTVTRSLVGGPDVMPEGFLTFTGRRDPEEILSQSGGTGPTAPPSIDRPFIPGGKVPFVFRSLPGYTFYAARAEREVFVDSPGGLGGTRWAEGWIRVTYYRPGDDEEHEHGGFAGPES